jgi:tRNA(fMet)-specific endonuclease VapC
VTRYLLDTNMVGHFIDHRRGVDERARDARARGTVIGTCMPVVAELFYCMVSSSAPRVKSTGPDS